MVVVSKIETIEEIDESQDLVVKSEKEKPKQSESEFTTIEINETENVPLNDIKICPETDVWIKTFDRIEKKNKPVTPAPSFEDFPVAPPSYISRLREDSQTIPLITMFVVWIIFMVWYFVYV
ncbi:unnamed protein product [Caenorhabditis angaria]|uniref:Uncharacterized protein n=1 Tax=Caenorhabditis angaria TaxID=860376 RepID=A0A9P1J3Y5_9PELO|nr:unnamed protein product [Caenorhabditis angaria]